MEIYKYMLECSACETEMELTVFEQDELPCYCPMCGDSVDEEWIEKEH